MIRRYLLLLAGVFAMFAAPAPAVPDEAAASAKAGIRHSIDLYTRSIDAADPDLGARIWLTTPEASFINPLGHEEGWDRIAAEVYVKLMGQAFSKRSLTVVGEPTIHIFGDTAVAEFDWNFVATRRSDGTEVHTTGRESQVYARFPGQGWRLVHVHYSALPGGQAAGGGS